METLETQEKYRLIPPERGWGYVITLSVIVINLIMLIPKVTFGLLYGDFLESVGDATKSTSLTIGIYNTLMSFTGILASFLLRRYTYRKVTFLGAAIYFIGAIGLIFVRTEYEMYFYFGVLQGIGCGLSFPGSFTALNFYFDHRLNLMVGLARVAMIFFTICFPHLITFLVGSFGFRATVGFVAATALLKFPAAWALHPIKWHMRKVLIEDKSCGDNLLKNDAHLHFVDGNAMEKNSTNEKTGNDNVTVTESSKEQKNPVKLLDFSLFKDLRFLNMSAGLALSYTSDVCFYSIIPLLLKSAGFSVDDQATMTMVFYICDLISRIAFSVACLFFKMRNRYLCLAASALSAVFRIAFTSRDDYWWRLSTLGILGFLRSYIQITFSLVISDEYKNNFATAFSLTLFICGVVNLITGPLMSYVKTATDSDILVAHVLTVAFVICTICWTIEIVYDWLKKMCREKSTNNSNSI